jgi:hypothetical protein
MTQPPNSTKLPGTPPIDFPCLVIVRPLPRLRVTATAEERMHELTSGEVTHGIDISAARKKRPRKPRRPSISKMIAQAEKAGKPVTSITTPDGMTLRFGEPEPGALENPWFADLDKAKLQ